MTKEHVPESDTNLSTYNYDSANWKNIKAALKKINWPEVLAESGKPHPVFPVNLLYLL